MNRRQWLGGVLSSAAALGFVGTRENISDHSTLKAEEKPMEKFQKPDHFKGNIHQSVSRWCYDYVPFEEFCVACRDMGLVGIDLIRPEQWQTMLDFGLTVTMGEFPGNMGFNQKSESDRLVDLYETYIPIAAELKVPNLICLSGNRGDLDDETGIKNCADTLKRIMPTAEKYNINIMMELLNEFDHKDYQCSRTAWGVDVCKKVGSPRCKLLYDIYHMQRMEGEIIGTIRKYGEYIGHYHTGGNPGRNDIDDTQEICYPPIMKAILETGYTGFVAHEFLPKDGLNSLYQAVKICDV